MVRIPGLDMFYGPGARDRPPNIFDNFFPIPTNIGDMRSEDDFSRTKVWKLKAPVLFTKAVDIRNNKEFSLLTYKETQNPDDKLKDILHEIEIVRYLDHDNVLKFYENVYGPELTDVDFLFEPVVEVFAEIIARSYDPPVIKTVMRDLFTALNYLHQNRIIHRDIQPENIILSSTGVFKVWNFRNARKLGQKPKKLEVNEFRYQSVELLMESEKYDESVDIWSANCIFAQLWLKKSLFPEHGREKVLTAIFKLLGFPGKEIWEEFHSFPAADDLRDFSNYTKYNMMDSYFKKYCDTMASPFAMDLMHRCFRFNPKYRPRAECCLMHPYFLEQPEACPAEDIISKLAFAAISDHLRIVKAEKCV